MNAQRNSRRKFPSLEKEGWLRPLKKSREATLAGAATPLSPRRGVFILVFALCATSAAAQETKAKPDMSGFWELRFDSKNIPQASLNARVTPKDIEAHRQKDLMAIRW